MKCSQIVVALLGAEREELEGIGSSPVAMHLRECKACRSVASRILADTAVLAQHVQSREATAAKQAAGRRASAVGRRALWGGAFAAAVFAVMFLTNGRRTPDELLSNSASSERVRSPQLASEPPKAVASSMHTRAAISSHLLEVQAKRFPAAVAATPARFIESQPVETSMRPSASSGVTVAPPVGMRSAVLATRNPKITIVWLY